MGKIEKGLTIVGMTELEAKVYLKLLEVKQAKVGELAKATRVTREQLYPLLEKLIEKNFLRKTSGRPTIYQVLKVEELIRLIEKWKKEQINVLKELEYKLKKLKRIHK